MSDAPIATFEQLLAKPRRTKTIELKLPGDDSSVVEVSLRFQALPGDEYDTLMAKYPPTDKQRKDGLRAFNPDTFPQALVAATLAEPQLTVDQVKQLWESPAWSDGDRNTLWLSALEVNQAGLDVPFTAPASDETDSSS